LFQEIPPRKFEASNAFAAFVGHGSSSPSLKFRRA
jgi:hypothetical protein